MYQSQTTLRTRYAETDQMGVVYYGNYPQYFEVGRVEALRALDLSYKQMEDDGIMLPVLKLEIKYLKPALYDDELTIKTFIKQMPLSRIQFEHEIYNSTEELLTLGIVELVFVDQESRKPRRCPQTLKDRILPYF